MMDWTPYQPNIENPYPDFPVGRISGFEFRDDLYISRKKDGLAATLEREAQYTVYTEYRCQMVLHEKDKPESSTPWRITVPAGFVNDLTSVPAPLRIFAGRVGKHLEAAIIHDYMFIAWQHVPQEARKRDFDFSNQVMDAAMRASDVAGWRRAGILFAVKSWRGRRRFFRRDPRPHFVCVPDPALPSYHDAPAATPVAEPPRTA